MRRLPAVVGGLALLGAGMFATATPAAAATHHVGVVVRYGNGHVSAGCATVGGTGLTVLGQHHHVRMGTQQYSGFVIRVDGVGTARPDNTHYWSYWHSGGHGGWKYASSGAASYRPKAGTVEGWSYVNGQGSAPRPPSRTFAALCGRRDAHTTSATPDRSGHRSAATKHPSRPATSVPTLAAEPAAHTSSTSAWPTVGALGVVALLGLTAWLVMRRRAG